MISFLPRLIRTLVRITPHVPPGCSGTPSSKISASPGTKPARKQEGSCSGWSSGGFPVFLFQEEPPRDKRGPPRGPVSREKTLKEKIRARNRMVSACAAWRLRLPQPVLHQRRRTACSNKLRRQSPGRATYPCLTGLKCTQSKSGGISGARPSHQRFGMDVIELQRQRWVVAARDGNNSACGPLPKPIPHGSIRT